jgi:PhnB protein
MEFCKQAFDAEELNRRPGPDGSVAHGLLKIGGEMLMIEGEWSTLPSRAPAADGTSPVVIYLYVPDVDATVERAVANGARILVPLQDQFWGDRIAWLIDPAGHVWTVASRIEDTTAEERTARWERTLADGR